MNKNEIKTLIESELKNYKAIQPKEGSTIGVPWSNEKVASYIPKLKAALVEPYLQKMLLKETHEQIESKQKKYANYWVIAEDSGYYQWYEPESNEYGLAVINDDQFESIGIRGNLVGVYCAM